MAVQTITIGARVTGCITDAAWARAAAVRRWMRLSRDLVDDDGVRYQLAKNQWGEEVIAQHPREDLVRYDRRRKGACPSSYVAQIAAHYLAHVLRQAPQRSPGDGGDLLPDPVQAIIDDADGLGTPLDRLLGAGLGLAFVEQGAYLLLDRMPSDPRRIILRIIPADDVLALTASSSGRVIEAMVRIQDGSGDDRVWRVDEENGQAATLDDTLAASDVADATPHGFAGCPLIPVGPVPSILATVAEYQRAICIGDSFLRYRNGEDSIPWVVVTGAQNPDGFVAELTKNPAFSAFSEENAKAQNIGATVEVAKSIRESMTDDEERLYRAAKVRPVAATGAPESGVAQAYRFVDADVELATMARCLQHVEDELWRLAQPALGVDEPVVTYPISFVPIDRGAELDRLMLISASTLPEPIKRREYAKAAQTLYPGDTELAGELADHQGAAT